MTRKRKITVASLSAGRSTGLLANFPKHVVEANGHWIWTGSTTGSAQPKARDGAKSVDVRRALYEATNGPIPDLWAVRNCDEPLCVYPEHVDPMTVTEALQFTASRRSKNVCINGHAMTPENRRGGTGACLTCAREKARAFRAEARRLREMNEIR